MKSPADFAARTPFAESSKATQAVADAIGGSWLGLAELRPLHADAVRAALRA